MSKKEVIRLSIDNEVLQKFIQKADDVGITASRFVQGCMKAYNEGKFKMLDGEPFFENSVPREAQDVPRAVGRPPKIKEEPKEELISDPVIAIKKLHSPEGLSPSKRKLISYRYPQRPIERDDTPALYFDTEDGKGGTFRDMVIAEWLPARIEIGGTIDDFFFNGHPNSPLNGFMELVANKFCEDNGLKFRYHKDEVWDDVISLNDALTIKHMKELEEKIPEMRDE